MKIKKIYETIEDDEILSSRIYDIFTNEVGIRQVKYTDDYEIDYEAVEKASKLIVEYLKKEYNLQLNVDAKKFNL